MDEDEQFLNDRLLHRDDLPFEVVEELEKQLAEKYPDRKIVFAGDAPEGSLPPEFTGAVEKTMQRFAESVAGGLCIDCGAAMPNYPEMQTIMDDGFPEDWQPADGWYHFEDARGAIMGWQCPACDAAEDEDEDG